MIRNQKNQFKIFFLIPSLFLALVFVLFFVLEAKSQIEKEPQLEKKEVLVCSRIPYGEHMDRTKRHLDEYLPLLIELKEKLQKIYSKLEKISNLIEDCKSENCESFCECPQLESCNGIGNPAQPPGIVIINEIAWMGTKASPEDEWIELLNNTDSDIDLDGWVLAAKDNQPGLVLSGIIPANGFYLLERGDDKTISDISADLLYSGRLDDGGEYFQLYDEEGTLMDEVNCETGWFAGDDNLKITMERINPKNSGSDPNNWRSNSGNIINGKDRNGENILGTPKGKNSVTPAPGEKGFECLKECQSEPCSGEPCSTDELKSLQEKASETGKEFKKAFEKLLLLERSLQELRGEEDRLEEIFAKWYRERMESSLYNCFEAKGRRYTKECPFEGNDYFICK